MEKKPSPVAPFLRTLLVAARPLVPRFDSFDIDPAKLSRMAEAVQNELLAAASDDTPDFLVIPGLDGLPWEEGISVAANHLREAMSRKDSKILVGGGANVVDFATIAPACEALRRRIATAVDGIGALPEKSQKLRDRLLAGRAVFVSRAAWESEFKLIAAGIEGLGDDAEPEVRALLPRIEAMLVALGGAAPGRGRKKKEQLVWSDPVREATLALNIALDRLLRAAAAHATDKRLASLNRIVLPVKRKAEKGAGIAREGSGTPVTTPAAVPATTPK